MTKDLDLFKVLWDFRQGNTGQGTLSRINYYYYKHVFIFFPSTTPVCAALLHHSHCCTKDTKFPKLTKRTVVTEYKSPHFILLRRFLWDDEHFL